MLYEFSNNQVQVQMLMQIVYLPMVQFEVAKYPLNKILTQKLHGSYLSLDQQRHTKEGIKALVELGIFAEDGSDICITNLSEGFLKIFDEISSKSAAQVSQELQGSTTVKSIFDAFENDQRFNPHSSVT